MIAACAYWWGERFRRERHSWDLKNQEAKLVQIYTDSGFRGLGLAPAMIGLSAEMMRTAGFEGLFARIWHNNVSSVRAFEKAGWLYAAFVVRLIFSDGRTCRLTLPTSMFGIQRYMNIR
jgi:ribosomal protein S18 acetylase RimI-like enzyme